MLVIDGALHPRFARRLLGQGAAEAAFLEAFSSGRLHHAWLLTGPRGVGKATLAWRLARFLLATPLPGEGLFAAPAPNTLDIDPAHPVAARVEALSEPRLFLLRRPWDEKNERLRTEITVDEMRRVKSFLALSAADGGRRVVILDAADEMNVNAANAMLKLLEEPPENVILLLVCHQPARLLPTILSRCRRLRLGRLGPDEIAQILAANDQAIEGDAAAVTALADGSAGAALRLIAEDGMALYAEILGLFTKGYDRQGALRLADSTTTRANAARFDLVLELLDLMLVRLARYGLSTPGPEAAPNDAAPSEAAPGEAALFARLSPDARAARAWAELQGLLSSRARHGQAVNLDPASLILDITFKINDQAAKIAA
jgi:DNA polymerase-3 subunit delta'